MVTRMEELTKALPEELLQKYSEEEYGVLIKDVKAGRLGKESENKHAKHKRRFDKLLVKDRIILTGNRVLIPDELRVSVLAAGHEWYPEGRQS